MEMDSDLGTRYSEPGYEDTQTDDYSPSLRHQYTNTQTDMPFTYLRGISESGYEEDDPLSRRHSIAVDMSRSGSYNAEEPKLSQEQFSNYCKGLLQICPRNRILMERLFPNSEELKFRSPSKTIIEESSDGDKTISTVKGLKVSVLETTAQSLDSSSCFCFFIIKGKNGLRNLVPDYEIQKCKSVFSDMVTKGKPFPEAHFGLGKLHAHEGKFKYAVTQIKAASDLAPEDLLYSLWEGIMLIFESSRNLAKTEALKSVRILESKIYTELLRQGYASIELYWGLLELSLQNSLTPNVEIELPQYYATKVKDIDAYYGYLAWAEVYINTNEPEKGRDVLGELVRAFPEIPEAYILLWNLYYHKLKDFAKAVDVSERAFVKVEDHESQQYKPAIALMYAKSLNKAGRLKSSFELLQHEYLEHPTFPVFLYQYGRLCVKSQDLKFNGSAIAALTECMRVCTEERQGCILFWLSKAYLQSKYCVQAIEAMTKALPSLESMRENTKIARLKSDFSELKSFEVSYETITQSLNAELLSPVQAEECRDNISLHLEPVDKLVADVLYTKLLWKEDRVEDALRLIEKSCQNAEVRLEGYLVWLKILKSQGDFEQMKAVAKAMVGKCKNKQVPAPVWLQAHVMYSKCLALCRETVKALAVLKCLAKILPPLPIGDIPYTKLLQHATTVQDLASASVKVMQFSPSNYPYRSYRNSFMRPDSDNYLPNLPPKNLPEQLSAAVSHMDTLKDEGESKDPAHKRVTSHVVDVFQSHPKQTSAYNSLTIASNPDDTETKDILNSRKRTNDSYYGVVATPTGVGAAVGFSICSDPKFLYKIGKVSAKSAIAYQDGLLALHDFLLIKSYQMKEGNEVWEQEMAKAKYWKALLHVQCKQYK